MKHFTTIHPATPRLEKYEVKLLLSIVLEWSDQNGSSTSRLTDKLQDELAAELFGDNNALVTVFDAVQLRREAHDEHV
jgi:hypothetical protein